MPEIIITNKKTLVNKLLNLATVGTMALGVYSGILLLSTLHKSCGDYRRASSVKKVIESNEYELASELLQSFQSENLLRPKDISKLNLLLKKEKETYQLEFEKEEGMKKIDNLLKINDVDNAKEILEGLMVSGIYSDEEINNLEKKIYDLTEQGLFEKANSAKGEEKENLYQQYSELYPNGPHKNKLIENLLIDNFNSLLGQLNRKSDFDKTYAQLTTINSLLEKYSSKEISLSDIISIKDLTTQATQYITLSETAFDGEIKVGSRVEVITAENGWKSEYSLDRLQNFPIGSVGEIIAFDESRKDLVYVKFKDVELGKWSRDWKGDKAYWQDGKKNVATYKLSELKKLIQINKIQKNLFKKEIKKLKTGFTYYK